MNPREIAIAVWSLVLLIYAMRSADVRVAMARTLRLLTRGRVLAVNLTGLLWALPVVASGIVLGLLGPSDVFATLVWLATVPLFLLFDVVSAKHRVGLIRRVVLKSLSISAMIEFVASNWTFTLPVEMVLVPITTVLVALVTVSQGRDEYQDVRRLLSPAVGTIGLVILLNGLSGLVRSASWTSLADAAVAFAGPVWLTIGFTPWVGLVAIYSDYDSAWTHLRAIGTPARNVKRSALRVFWILGLRHDLVVQWRDQVIQRRVRSPREAVDIAREVRY